MPRTSNRSATVLASPIRKFLPLVKKIEQQGITVIKLNVGDPDIRPDKRVFSGIKQYANPTIPYAPSPGMPEHVDAWISYYKKFKINLKPTEIIPTVGCAEAMFFSILATCDPGDELLVFEPLYASYKGFAALANVTLRPITLLIERGFSLPSRKTIEQHITKKTKAIIVINPNNPTGSVLSRKEIQLLTAIAQKKKLFIIADETYRDIVFDAQPASFLSDSKAREHVIVLDSASKRFSVPGARVGVLVSKNKHVMDAVLRMAMVRLSVPTIEQHALIPLLTKPQHYVTRITAEYKKRRNIVIKALRSIPGVATYAPQGALYVLAGLPVADAEDFIVFMLTKFSHNNTSVLVTPAQGFYITPHLGKNQIRIAYVVGGKKLVQAMDILKRGLEEYTRISKFEKRALI